MDPKHHDKVFIVTFLGVIGFLGAFTVAILIIANWLDPGHPDDGAVARLEDRIRPAGQVVTDPAALLKVSAPAATARAPMTAEQVVARVCAACHQTGVLAAPRIGDSATWAQRKAALGLEGLLKSTIAGKNAMPARGGDPSLTDEEIRAAIALMLKQSGV